MTRCSAIQSGGGGGGGRGGGGAPRPPPRGRGGGGARRGGERGLLQAVLDRCDQERRVLRQRGPEHHHVRQDAGARHPRGEG
ncbi:hypothetical protein, partial [Nocardia asiatica]|uniref:hypothetical protein n=1 Tax=Nocardia asiatica TaxID=209252 RepID=UPI00245446A9